MRLLLVEDDLSIGESLKELLVRLGYLVDWAKNKTEGLEKIFADDYDLLILDWMLPDGNGLDLCREVRQEKINTPVLILTAKGQVDDKVEGFESGADDYLSKPFDMRELQARIKALLRRKDEFVQDKVIVGDLEIDFGTRLVKRNGSLIELSPKEYGILEYLLRNRERVVDRGELLSHVWDENADLFSNTVDVHIRYLRIKIEEGFKTKIIETVKGKGYRICSD